MNPLWAIAAVVLTALAWLGPGQTWLARLREDRARANPQLDPVARTWTSEDADVLEAAVDEVAVLEACRRGLLFYRMGLRERHFTGSLEATRLAALGEIDAAEALLATLPPEDAEACVARSLCYIARGDKIRAVHALRVARERTDDPDRIEAMQQALDGLYGRGQLIEP